MRRAAAESVKSSKFYLSQLGLKRTLVACTRARSQGPWPPRDRLPVRTGWRFGEAGCEPLKTHGLGWDKLAN